MSTLVQNNLALIVDDEPDICELLEITLSRMDINTLSANDLATAYKHLSEHDISICLTDMRLPDGNGLDLVKKIQNNYSHIPVAMISAHGNMDTAIEALKSGAFDFVSKPVVLAELRNLIQSAIQLAEKNKLKPSLDAITSGSLNSGSLNSGNISSESLSSGNLSQTQNAENVLIGVSPQIKQVHTLIQKLSKSQAPVFISGESGTGKELAAKLIHQFGHREKGRFVPINCGAIPSELMESEFFGHKKGSSTGAFKDKKGLFQSANGGTLFLDEVADLPLNMQVKLLRAIQEKRIKPVGDEKEQRIDVRIISATHKDLKALVNKELFRKDLYYRINVIELEMPNLRSRTQDITLLCNHLLQKLSPNIPITLSKAALNALKKQSFPGNVRELENILERAITLCDNNIINLEDINIPKENMLEEQAQTNQIISNYTNNNTNSHANKNANGQLPNKDELVETLDNTKWNRKAAASLLGITYRQLRYRLKKFGLE